MLPTKLYTMKCYHISGTTNPKFHHILTQEILTEDSLLNVRQMGEEPPYDQFGKESFTVKTKELSLIQSPGKV